jgi:arylsulfatase A-like enzyme
MRQLRSSIAGGLALLAVVLVVRAGEAAGEPISVGDPEARARQPNIVFVTSDDHRWDALGAAGNPVAVTPRMDQMAREGVYFRQATVSVSQCHPVRASLLTGLPSFVHGVWSVKAQAPGVEESLCARPTVSGLLQAHGYRTVLVGKWHLPPPPWECAFEEVKRWIPGGGGHFLDPELAHGRSEEYLPVEGYTQELLMDDALAFLRDSTARERPFLLWLGLTAPHLPYGPSPERIEALYADLTTEDLLPPGFPPDIETNDWRVYLEAVSFLDEQLGRLLDTLRETGLDQDTVVVFLGDNGYMMGERGIGGPSSGANGKTVPYESSLRVPFILLGPGLPGPKGASNLPVSSLDVPPTLLSLAGVPIPEAWPGRNLVAALGGEIEVEEAFAEWSDETSEKFGALAFRAVRTPLYKLVEWQDPERRDELYDLVADPRESHNLVADPAAAPVLADLRRRLREWMERTEDPALAWTAPETGSAESGGKGGDS